jgi:hypothetical protein
MPVVRKTETHLDLIDGIDLTAGVQPTAKLIDYLSVLPLYSFCGEQIQDACRIVDQCTSRLVVNGATNDLKLLCLEAIRNEESIFQLASTPPVTHLADGIRHFTCCESASDEEAYAAYAIVCAIKAIESLNDWMQATSEDAVSTNWKILELPWEDFETAVMAEVNPYERIEALDSYVAHLEVITSLLSVYDNDITELASAAMKSATKRKGGILSGIDRKEEISVRDAAIVQHARGLQDKGLPRRNVATKVHLWLENQVALPSQQRPNWLPPDVEKALTRRQVDAILDRYEVV